MDRLLRYGKAKGVRYGGIIDVVDAVEHEHTVDTAALAPARFTATSLVVINKIDLLPASQREATVPRIGERVRERNPGAAIVPVERAALDPQLVFDIAHPEDPIDELPLAAAARAAHDHSAAPHAHAVTVPAGQAADPGVLLDLLEAPPAGVYRLKGHVRLRHGTGSRRYLVNQVGWTTHLVPAHPASVPADDGLVAIGTDLDEPAVELALRTALAPADHAPTEHSLTRLERRLILSGNPKGD